MGTNNRPYGGFINTLSNYYYKASANLFMEDLFNKQGIIKPRKTYYQVTRWGLGQRYSLTQEIRLNYLLSYTIIVGGYNEEVLKGCIINGVVYRDTSFVSVEEENQVSVNFILQQKYSFKIIRGRE